MTVRLARSDFMRKLATTGSFLFFRLSQSIALPGTPMRESRSFVHNAG
jgi:hypothetical protein